METIIFIISMLLVALGTASLGHTFQKFLEPGQIFNWWALALMKLIEAAGKERIITRGSGCGRWVEERKAIWYIRLLAYFAKPLGLCVYCNSTWIAIITFILMYGFRLEIFLFIGFNFIFVVLISKITNNAK